MKIDYTKKLKEFSEELKKIPEIIAVCYTGSTAKKSWDKYSDLDIDIIVKNKDFIKIKKIVPKLMNLWGKVNLTCYYKNSDETYAFIGKDYLKVEIEILKKENLKPDFELRDIRIEFDKDGTLTKVSNESKKLKKDLLDKKEFNHLFLDMRSNFIYVARHYARGQKLSGASELNRIGGDLFYYLAKLKNLEDYELLRKAEKHLTKKEWNFIEESRCHSVQKEEVKRAIKAKWKYMKYLEKEYEKLTKTKLNLDCNDKEILKIIERTLK